MASDNLFEWIYVLTIWYDIQPQLAYFGWFWSMVSFWLAWLVLLFPEIKPDASRLDRIGDAPFFWEGFGYWLVDKVGNFILP